MKESEKIMKMHVEATKQYNEKANTSIRKFIDRLEQDYVVATDGEIITINSNYIPLKRTKFE